MITGAITSNIISVTLIKSVIIAAAIEAATEVCIKLMISLLVGGCGDRFDNGCNSRVQRSFNVHIDLSMTSNFLRIKT